MNNTTFFSYNIAAYPRVFVNASHSSSLNHLLWLFFAHIFRNFLEKKVGGPLKTVYFKPDPRNNEAVIAVRFDDKEKAKICVETLHKTLMLGSKVFIDYYQDFNRHNEYIGLTLKQFLEFDIFLFRKETTNR